MENITQNPVQEKRHPILKGCLIFFILFFMLVMFLCTLGGCAVLAIYILDHSENEYPEVSEISVGNGGPEKIIQINISGVIREMNELSPGTDSKSICRMLDKAENDRDVRGVILYLNTPGGEVTAADMIHQKILDVRKKKPVIAFMSSMATSGGYYIACACNRIIASRTTLTGSIGVIISTYNVRDLCEWFGVHSEVYKSGPMKDMLNPLGKRTSEEEEIVQNLVNESYALFLKLVSNGRKIPVEKLRKSQACDGRVLSAQEALNYKLIDELGRFENAVAAIEKSAGVPAGSLKIVQYQRKGSFMDALLEMKSRDPARVSLEVPGIRKESLPAGRLYFLPANF